jgi:hypothetical protein
MFREHTSDRISDGAFRDNNPGFYRITASQLSATIYLLFPAALSVCLNILNYIRLTMQKLFKFHKLLKLPDRNVICDCSRIFCFTRTFWDMLNKIIRFTILLIKQVFRAELLLRKL